MFLRVPGVKNVIFRRPDAIRWAVEYFFFGALGPHLHRFFGLFLKQPSFIHNLAFDALFFFIFAESLDELVEKFLPKDFKN